MPQEAETLPTQPRDPSPLGDIMETLPTYRSRAFIYLLVLLAVVLVIYSAFGKVDILVSAPASLVPVGQVKLIQIDTEGVVSELSVQEGSLVHKGERLATIDAKEVGTYLLGLRAAEVDMADASKDVE